MWSSRGAGGNVSGGGNGYRVWWRTEQTWRAATALFWHAACMTTLLHVWSFQMRTPLDALRYFVSLQWIWNWCTLNSVVFTSIFVAAQCAVLIWVRMRSYRVSLDVSSPVLWRALHGAINPTNWIVAAVFLASALATVWSYSALNDVSLLWRGTEINDDTVFVVLGVAAFALTAAARSIFCHEHTLRFAAAGVSSRLARAKSAAVSVLVESARTTLWFLLLWSAVHWPTVRWNRAIGVAVIRASGLDTPIASAIAATADGAATAAAATAAGTDAAAAAAAEAVSTTAATAFGSVTAVFPVHIGSVIQLGMWCLLLCIAWSWSRVIIDLFMTELIAFDRYLLRGLVDVRNTYVRHMAFLDLQDVSEFSVARRRDIINPTAATLIGGDGSASDAGYGSGSLSSYDGSRLSSGNGMNGGAIAGSGSYFEWPSRAEVVAITRPVLIATGTNELAIGVRSSAFAASSLSSAASIDSGSGRRRSFDDRVDRIMESPPAALILESALSLLTALTDAVAQQTATSSLTRSGLVNPIRGGLTASSASSAASQSSRGGGGGGGWFSSARSTASSPDSAGWLSLTPEQRAEQIFAHTPMHIAAIQSVSMLLAAAATEDPSGSIAFQSVGDVLSTYLALSLALEEYSAGGAGGLAAADGSGSGSGARGNHFLSTQHALQLRGQPLIRPPVQQLAFHLDNAIYRVVTTYYQQLSMFILPAVYARRLQAYVDFAK